MVYRCLLYTSGADDAYGAARQLAAQLAAEGEVLDVAAHHDVLDLAQTCLLYTSPPSASTTGTSRSRCWPRKPLSQIRISSWRSFSSPKMLSLIHIWDLKSREECIEYAKAHNIPISQTVEKIYSRDENIWHISHEGGNLENPWNEHKPDIHVLSIPPEDAPDQPTYVEIDFEQGIPVAIDGEKLPPVDLLKKLNKLGSENGIGTIDIIENRLVGMKSRGVYETPGGTILFAAHKRCV